MTTSPGVLRRQTIMSRFFVFVIALAAIVTIFKYTIKTDGTRTEKFMFLGKTSKQVVFGIKIPRYAGRHWVRKELLA
jgi:hypothetical protein